MVRMQSSRPHAVLGRAAVGLALCLFGGSRLASAQISVAYGCVASEEYDVIDVFSCPAIEGDSIVLCFAMPEAPREHPSVGGLWGVLCYDDTGTGSNIWHKERDTWNSGSGIRLMCFDALQVHVDQATGGNTTIRCVHEPWGGNRAGLAMGIRGVSVREPADRFQLNVDISSSLSGLDAAVPLRVYPNDVLIMAAAVKLQLPGDRLDHSFVSAGPGPGWTQAPTPFAVPTPFSGSTATDQRQIVMFYRIVSSVFDEPRNNAGSGSLLNGAMRPWAAGVFALSAGYTPTPPPTAVNTNTPTP